MNSQRALAPAFLAAFLCDVAVAVLATSNLLAHDAQLVLNVVKLLLVRRLVAKAKTGAPRTKYTAARTYDRSVPRPIFLRIGCCPGSGLACSLGCRLGCTLAAAGSGDDCSLAAAVTAAVSRLAWRRARVGGDSIGSGSTVGAVGEAMGTAAASSTAADSDSTSTILKIVINKVFNRRFHRCIVVVRIAGVANGARHWN